MGLGADIVVDYHEQNIFDTLGNDTVDVVFDNLGFPGTADKALRTIRSGGTFLLLPGRRWSPLQPDQERGHPDVWKNAACSEGSGDTRPAVRSLGTSSVCLGDVPLRRGATGLHEILGRWCPRQDSRVC